LPFFAKFANVNYATIIIYQYLSIWTVFYLIIWPENAIYADAALLKMQLVPILILKPLEGNI